MSEMTFEQWKERLEIELSMAFGTSGKEYVKATGDECWREMFEDGLTPAQAASEEVQAAAESL